MAQRINNKKIASNVMISVAVQGVSLIVSLLCSLFIPKGVAKSTYALWQTFMLYQSYVGILHFGILDGILLRYSQYDYEELDKARIRSQLRVMLAITSVATLITSLVSVLSLGGDMRNVFILIAFSIVSKNLFTYASYTFQITNRIKKYALLVLIQRGLYGVIIAFLLIFKVDNYLYFCLAEFAGDLVAIFVTSFMNKELYVGKGLTVRESVSEAKLNIGAGVMLLIANWSFIFIVGSARMVVGWRYDDVVFADVSFAFSVSNMFLNFVTAVSVVLFPSLKRLKAEELPNVFDKLRRSMSLLLLFVLLLYFPGAKILNLWLPNYADGVKHLGLLLPIIVYSSKVNLLTNNFLKVYRKEKAMAFVNSATIVIGLTAFLLCAYVFNSLTALLVSIVVATMLNSLVAEIIVMNKIKKHNYLTIIAEGALSAVFIVSAVVLNGLKGAIIYLLAVSIYGAVVIITHKRNDVQKGGRSEEEISPSEEINTSETFDSSGKTETLTDSTEESAEESKEIAEKNIPEKSQNTEINEEK